MKSSLRQWEVSSVYLYWIIVKNVIIEGCSKSTASEFFEIGKKGKKNNSILFKIWLLEFDSNSDTMQSNKISLEGANSLMFLKLTILDGYDQFASIHYLEMV